MTDHKLTYDWAGAALSVEQCDSTDLRQLVSAAKLDAENGDLTDVDLSNMDLRGQDLSGWDLRSACFQGARIANADLSGTKINFESLTDAEDWQKAKLDEKDMLVALETAVKKIKVRNLNVSVRTDNCLRNAHILSVGQIMDMSGEQLLRTPFFGPRTLNELKEALSELNVVYIEDAISHSTMHANEVTDDEILRQAKSVKSSASEIKKLLENSPIHTQAVNSISPPTSEYVQQYSSRTRWAFHHSYHSKSDPIYKLLKKLDDLKT